MKTHTNADDVILHLKVNNPDQLFTFTQGSYIVLDPNAIASTECLGGSPCCIENWMGSCTVFGCSTIQSIKMWNFDNTTGAIENRCVGAVAGAGPGAGAGAGAWVRVDGDGDGDGALLTVLASYQ